MLADACGVAIPTGRRRRRAYPLRRGGRGEEMPVGTRARQTEADAPGVAPDDGANLQELEGWYQPACCGILGTAGAAATARWPTRQRGYGLAFG
jgi:hypothetical protein